MSEGGRGSVGNGAVKREPQDPARSWGWDNYCQPYPERSKLIALVFHPSGGVGWQQRVGGIHTWEKAWLLQRGLSFLE